MDRVRIAINNQSVTDQSSKELAQQLSIPMQDHSIATNALTNIFVTMKHLL